MRNLFKRRNPSHRRPYHAAAPLSLEDARTASAWVLTASQWCSLSDFERAECRRNVTAAPRFTA